MYVLPTNHRSFIGIYIVLHQLLTKRNTNRRLSNTHYLGIQNFKNRKEKVVFHDLLEQNYQARLNIGTAGGWTKASTGYTFKNSDKKSSQLVASSSAR
jgi:lycopene beta-cyclase